MAKTQENQALSLTYGIFGYGTLGAKRHLAGEVQDAERTGKPGEAKAAERKITMTPRRPPQGTGPLPSTRDPLPEEAGAKTLRILAFLRYRPGGTNRSAR